MQQQQAFLAVYREKLLACYVWAQKDSTKLDRFMRGVKSTIEGKSEIWINSGECVNQAWYQIGQQGKPSMKALRALSTLEIE